MGKGQEHQFTYSQQALQSVSCHKIQKLKERRHLFTPHELAVIVLLIPKINEMEGKGTQFPRLLSWKETGQFSRTHTHTHTYTHTHTHTRKAQRPTPKCCGLWVVELILSFSLFYSFCSIFCILNI